MNRDRIKKLLAVVMVGYKFTAEIVKVSHVQIAKSKLERNISEKLCLRLLTIIVFIFHYTC